MHPESSYNNQLINLWTEKQYPRLCFWIRPTHCIFGCYWNKHFCEIWFSSHRSLRSFFYQTKPVCLSLASASGRQQTINNHYWHLCISDENQFHQCQVFFWSWAYLMFFCMVHVIFLSVRLLSRVVLFGI